MALKREFLKAMGLSEEQISAIVENHLETVNALKKERDEYKASTDASAAVAKERDDLKAQLEAAGDAVKIRSEFDAYRQQVEQEKVRGRKATALDKLLTKAGVARESFRATLGKTWDMDKIELDENGGVKNEDALVEAVKRDYPDFVADVHTVGAPPTNPPPSPAKTYTREEIKAMSPEEINKNWDAIKETLASGK